MSYYTELDGTAASINRLTTSLIGGVGGWGGPFASALNFDRGRMSSGKWGHVLPAAWRGETEEERPGEDVEKASQSQVAHDGLAASKVGGGGGPLCIA